MIALCKKDVRCAQTCRLSVTDYRFYVLNRHNHITQAHVAECEGVDDIQRTAIALLAEHQGATAVEAWERDKVVFRTERPARGPVTSAA
jgi:hypothetical protein